MDEADDHFDEGLEFPWYAAGRFLSNATEHGKEQQTENHREEHGVNVERPEGGCVVVRIHQRECTQVQLEGCSDGVLCNPAASYFLEAMMPLPFVVNLQLAPELVYHQHQNPRHDQWQKYHF